MKVDISVIDLNKVPMVKVRDVAHPSLFGLAPLVPDALEPGLSEEELMEAAIERALEQLKEKKQLRARARR